MFNSGFRGKRAGDNQGTVNLQTSFVQNIYPQPTITGWSISGTDDTALNPAGGQTVLVNGTGFASGVAATLNGSTISPVTLVNPTQISFTSPALAGGSYSLIVYNSSGGAAILVPGLVYSSVPTYTTAAGSIGNIYETNSISTQVIATSDSAITYSLASGTLPSGATLYANGVITGTAPVDSASTTYTFGVTATDAELQDVTRTFTLTINTDNVTWSNPSSNTSINLDGTAYSNTLSATSAAGKSITYTANSLPTGLTLSTATISGTPTIAGTTTTLLTATAATTNRINQRTITWIVELTDPYFKYVTLLLTGETTVTPFISDASTNSFGLTINGDTKPVLFNPYTPGYYSNFFDGTGDYLSAPPNAAFAFGTGDYTLEFWVYSSISWASTICFYNNYAGGYFLQYATGTGLQTGIAGSSATGTYAVTLTSNNWNHIAVSRASGSSKCFVNGTQVGTTVTDNTNYAQTGATIGALYNGSQTLTGYISNLRVVNGTAVYTSNFTPSTTPLTAIANTSLLTCQSNRLIDNSTNNFTITKAGDTTVSSVIPFASNSSYSTYGSTYFDGTGDTLTISSLTPGLSFGTGEFTIECWVYKTSAVNAVLLDARSSAAALPWVFAIDGSNFPYWYDGTVYTSTVAVTLNSWNHAAVVKTSGVLKIFVNGVQGYSASYGTNLDRTAGLVIGDTVHAAGPLLGYISNLRIVKGTAVYTSAFTPPTSPLTAIANTSLLTLQYNGGATNKGIIDNSNVNNIITRAGNTSQGSFSPYSVTGWSNYFDGGTNRLTTTTSSAFNLTGTSITLECWVYMTVAPAVTNRLITIGPNDALSSLNFQIATDRVFGVSIPKGGAPNVGSGSTLVPLNTWTHLAFTLSGSTGTLYINGTQVGQSAGWSIASSVTNYFYIGYDATATVDGKFTGYVSNVRLLVGTALYTSAFTPSTTPLTAIANTAILTCQSNRFVDNSPNSFTLTRNGNVTVEALDPFGSVPEAVPISYSVYFDGTGDYLTVANNIALQLGSTYTVEVWCYLNSYSSNDRIIADGSTNAADLDLGVGSDGRVFYAGAIVYVGDSYILPLSTWTHIAVVVNAGTLSIYINGVSKTLIGTTTGYNHTNSGTKYIGAYVGGSLLWRGYISNLRLVKGTAVYTSNFTPPTQPLTAIANTSLLTCQSTRMIDNSTNNFTLTAAGDVKPRIFNPFGYTAQSTTSYTPSLHGGSVYLDGTGDSLTTPNIAFSLSSTIWGIEYWIYPTTIASGYYGLWALSTSGFRQGIYADSGTHYLVVLSGGGGYGGFSLVAANKVITLNNWQHVALTSDGTTIRQFYNGVQTSTGPAAAFSADTPTVGSWGGANYFTGYMSDFRITKGSAVYTSNFVPPAQALSNYSTNYPASLLLNFNNGGIIDLHGSNVLETVGNTQLSTSIKKYGNSSIYFDGTGDYLKVPSSVAFAFGTGDFTWEAWVYFNSTGSRIIDFNTGILWLTSGTLQYYSGSGRITSDALTLGQWYHIALVRGSGVTKMYINGTQNGVNFTDSINYPTNALIIGADSGSLTQFMNGYIDDLRITKGYARYTSNFTPPTSALIGK